MVHPVPVSVTAGAITFGLMLLAIAGAQRHELRRVAGRFTGRRERERAMLVRLAQVNAMQVYSAELVGEHEVGVN